MPDTQAYISRDNRAFRFSDGFFESIRIINGKPVFIENHFSRVVETAAVLRIRIPESLTVETLYQQIFGLLQRNQITQGGRVRITFYRKSAGFYLPKEDTLGWYIESESMANNAYELNPVGLNVDIFTDLKKDINKLSLYKTLNCQLYVMAALNAKEKGLDESLIQNMRSSIIEATSSNIFIVSNGVLYTPSLADGCLGGTMRMNIINLALENKIKVYEATLNPQNLLTADEVFLTNAIRGIEWVASYRTKRYFNEIAKRLTILLNESALKYEPSFAV
jgi:branched-chain amino acid aminotransferase